MAVGVYVGSFAKIATVASQTITLPTGCPDLSAAAAGTWAIHAWTAGSDQATGTWDVGIGVSNGYSAGAANSYSVGATSDDGVGTSNTAHRMAAKLLTLPTTSGAGTQWECDFTDFPVGGTTMRWNWTTNAGGTEQIMFVIYTGLTNAKVLTWQIPTTVTTSTVVVTGAGFSPDLVLHAQAHLNGSAIPGSGTGALFGFGMMNKQGQQGANAIGSADAQVGASNTSRWQQTDACLLDVAVSEGIYHEVQFKSMDSDGFSVYATNPNGVNYDNIISLCMAGVSSKIGAFTKPATAATFTQTIGRVGFTPKGLLLTSVDKVPSASPVATVVWTLGATDGTNSRLAAANDRDAFNPTNAGSAWRNDRVLTLGMDGRSFDTRASLSAFTTDGFTLSFDASNTAIQEEVLYLAVGNSGTATTPSVTLDSATTNAAATAYSNQKHGCTLSTGRHVRVVAETTTNARFEWSDGTFNPYDTTDFGADVAGWSEGSIDCFVAGGTEYLVTTWKQSGTGGSPARTNGFIYVMVGSFNAGRTTITWGSPLDVQGTAVMINPDVVVTPYSTGGLITVVCTNGNTSNAPLAQWWTTSGTTLTSVAATYLSTNGSSGYGSAASVTNWCSAAVDPATKNVHVAWSTHTTGAGKGVRYAKLTHNGSGSYTLGTEVEVDNTVYASNSYYGVVCRWDASGSRAVIGGLLAAAGNALRVWDSTNFTTFTSRVSTTLSDAVAVLGVGMAVDSTTGDVYLTGSNQVGAPWANVVYYKATRSGTTLTLGSMVTTDSFIGNGGAPSLPFPYAWYANSAINWIYTRGNNSPYGIGFDRLVLNTTPTVTLSSPSDAATLTDTTPDLSVLVTDPDATQTLTVTFDVATDSGFTAIVFTGTQTTSTPSSAAVVTTTCTTTLSYATTYYWRAKVSDGTATSAYTATRTFTIPYDLPTVTIGASTPATTTSTGGPSLTITYTYAQAQSLAQASRRIRVQNAAGSTTYYDTGVIAAATTTVTLDAVALGIPTDTTGTALKVVVDVVAATSAGAGTATKAFDIQWGVVSCTVTAPLDGAVVTDSTPTVDWTFASTRSKAQGYFRVRVLLDGTTTVHSDSGKTAGTDATYTVATPLVDNNVYDVEVTLWNAEGVSN